MVYFVSSQAHSSHENAVHDNDDDTIWRGEERNKTPASHRRKSLSFPCGKHYAAHFTCCIRHPLISGIVDFSDGQIHKEYL